MNQCLRNEACLRAIRAAILAGFVSSWLKSPRDFLIFSAFTSLPFCSNGIINQTACCLNADEEYAKNSRCRPARLIPCYENLSQNLASDAGNK